MKRLFGNCLNCMLMVFCVFQFQFLKIRSWLKKRFLMFFLMFGFTVANYHKSKISRLICLLLSVRNTALNYLDKEKRNKVIQLEDLSVSISIDEICPESELISKELKSAIGRAVDHLPERCKLIFSLAKIEQLKYKEIAQILDISVKTIDNQLAIAMKKIGDEILLYLGD
jgi:DNA-directed RNA polymerase specialized sigma subunit